MNVDIQKLKESIINLMTDEDFIIKNHNNETIRMIKEEKYNTINQVLQIISFLEMEIY